MYVCGGAPGVFCQVLRIVALDDRGGAVAALGLDGESVNVIVLG